MDRFSLPALPHLCCAGCIWRGSALCTLADHPAEFHRLPGPVRVRTNARKVAIVNFCDTLTILNGGDVESRVLDQCPGCSPQLRAIATSQVTESRGTILRLEFGVQTTVV
mgnify:CR=1 FL=1